MASLEEGSPYREAKLKKKLKKLNLQSLGFSSDFSSEMLYFIFSSSDLKSLDVFFCDALTDESSCTGKIMCASCLVIFTWALMVKVDSQVCVRVNSQVTLSRHKTTTGKSERKSQQQKV